MRPRSYGGFLCPTDFNPRTPCGVRRSRTENLERRNAFQSTHPLRGATICFESLPLRHDISIHAPLAGCDPSPNPPAATRHYFNPRTPCGVRLRLTRLSDQRLNFNPRTPCGVRLAAYKYGDDLLKFQSTHPLRGATAKLPKYSRKICAKATKFLQSQTKSGVAACWAKGKQPLFPALRGANLPGKTGTLPVRIR